MSYGVHMPIEYIHVENFKSFSELDIELSMFHVVIGSNAAGKSNFISIFRFLRDITRNGIINAIAMQGGSEYLQNTNIGPSRDLVIRVVYQPVQQVEVLERECRESPFLAIRSCQSSYEFALRFDHPGDGFSITRDRLIIGCEVMSCDRNGNSESKTNRIGRGEIQVTNDGGELSYVLDLPEGFPLTEQELIPVYFRGKRIPEKTLLLETPYAYPLPHIEKFFDRIAVYDIDPKLLKKGVAITGTRDLEEDAGNLALVLKNIIGDPDKKRKFSNLLRDVLPFVEDFSVEKFMDISLILTLRERYAKNHDLPSTSLSDGTMTIFALIIALYFEDKPFIIIEEPVSHIHPFLVGRVVTMMKECSKRKQIMITTHSTEVVKHASIEDLLLISRDTEGFSVVSRPADKEEVRTFLENEIGIEELYIQNLLGL
jgi:predicted ATPase